jgi:hypothetical protein
MGPSPQVRLLGSWRAATFEEPACDHEPQTENPKGIASYQPRVATKELPWDFVRSVSQP